MKGSISILRLLILLGFFVMEFAAFGASVPDIYVSSSVTADPDPATAGSSVNIKFKITNQGSADAKASTTKIQIKNSGGTTLVQNTFSTAALAVGASKSVSYALTLPSNASGTCTAYIILDNANEAGQTGSGYNNDMANGSFSVSSGSASVPDIYVSSSVTADPDPATAGNSVNIKFKITNQGTADAKASTTKVQIKNSSGSILAQDTFSTPAIAAGVGKSVSYALTLPSNASGTCTAYVILDNSNEAGQTGAGYNNDNANGAFSVGGSTASAPDIYVSSSVTADPDPATAGGSVNIKFKITNQGSADAKASTTKVQVKNSSNSILAQNTFSTPAIVAGAGKSVSFALTLPSNASGTCTAYVILDNLNEAGQTSSGYNNDNANGTFSVGNSTADVPDIYVSSSVTADPDPAKAGSSVNIKFKITNQGSADAKASTTKVQIKNSSGSILAQDTFSTPAIAAGVGQSVSFALTLPSNASGACNAYVILDNLNEAGQTGAGYNNDNANGAFSITSSTVSGPDIYVSSSVTADPDPATAGGSVNIKFKITNQGSVDAGASTTKIQIKNGSNSILAQNTFPTPTIPAGTGKSVSFALTLPSSASGTCTAYVILDNSNEAGQTGTGYNNDNANGSFTVNIATGYSISGYVYDKTTLTGVANAVVGISNFTSNTDPSGHYAISGLPKGTFELTTAKIGYAAYSEIVTPSTNSSHNITITPNTANQDAGTLSGTVVDTASGKKLTGVKVDLYDGAGTTRSITTDSSGFNFGTLPGGYYTISVFTVPGFLSYSRLIRVAGETEFKVQLIKPAAAYGSQTASSYSKDPVNTATGNYVYSRTDLRLPGKGMPFSFTRNYNSQDSTTGPLGYGWSHSYNLSLSVDTAGNVTLRLEDGRTETFALGTAGAFTPQVGVFDTLIGNGDGTYTLRQKNQTVYNFDASRRLSSIIDKNGNTIALTYTNGNLTRITDTAGRNIDFTIDANGRITKITEPLSRTVQFSYDANGNLVTATDKNGNVTQYAYDANHQITSVTDPRGNKLVSNVYDADKRVVTSQKDAKNGETSYQYDTPQPGATTVTQPLGRFTIDYHDALKRLIRQDDALGHTTRYAYDDAGNRVSVTDRNGNNTAYGYDANGNVTSKTDSFNHVTTITYDGFNNPLSRTDALGNSVTFTYDALGNLLTTTDPLGGKTITTYDPAGLPLTLTNALGKTTTYTYDATGNLTQVLNALGGKTIYTYDAAARKLTQKDALDHVTTFAYDNNDNLLSVIDPLSKSIVSTYDGNDNRVTVTDKRGNKTKFIYDVKDLLTTTTDPLDGVVTNGYDALDQKVSVKDANGGTTQFGYDLIGNLVSTTDALGKVTQYTYDANGNRLSVKNPLGNTTAFTYDALDRLVQAADPLGNATKTEYDALGRKTKVTDANGKATSFEYDAVGHLTKVTDANGGTVIYAYDLAGNRIAMTDPNAHTTNYIYDALNRLAQTKDPSTGIYQNGFDAAGNLVSKKDANGNTIGYTYDANNQRTGINYPSGSPVTFSYDANGNRTGMIDALGTSSFQFDVLNRMTIAKDAYNITVGYSYDANGNRLSIIYPGSKTVTYAYDADNRMSSVTDWLTHATSYSYDDAGNLVGTTNANGTTAAYTFDTAGRLTGLANAKADSTVICSYSLTLDGVGNHTQATQAEPLLPSVPSQNTTYTYDSDNRLSAPGVTAFIYDANGNLTAKDSDTYSYDFENRLTQVSVASGTSQHQYDGLGNRKSATSPAGTKHFVLDINGSLSQVLGETDGTGNVNAFYIYGLGLVSCITPGNAIFYYHYDVRGSTIALSDTAASLIMTYAYEPFGKVANVEGTTANPFRFVGKYGVMDEENGLDYVRARFLNPGLGRFITKDPLPGSDGDTQSLHRYLYALNNPVVMVDSSGFVSWSTVGVGALEVAASYGALSASILSEGADILTNPTEVQGAISFVSLINSFNEANKTFVAGGVNIVNGLNNRAEISPKEVQGVFDPYLNNPAAQALIKEVKAYQVTTGVKALLSGDAAQEIQENLQYGNIPWQALGVASGKILSIYQLPDDFRDLVNVIDLAVPEISETQSFKLQSYKK